MPALDPGVPIVLDLVVRPSRELQPYENKEIRRLVHAMKMKEKKKKKQYMGSHLSPFVAELSMKAKDEKLLFGGEHNLLQIRMEVVDPSETTALAAMWESAVALNGFQISLTMFIDVLCQHSILCRRPWTFLQPLISFLSSSLLFYSPLSLVPYLDFKLRRALELSL